MPKIPAITWYQTKDNIYVNLEIGESSTKVREYLLNVEKETFEFAHYSYLLSFQLFNPVTFISSIDNGRFIKVCLAKQIDNNDDIENTSKFWLYLSKDKTFNKSHIKIDWSNWIDEDDDEYADTNNDNDNDNPGMNLGMEEMMAMNGGGGGGGGFDMQKMQKMMETMGGCNERCGEECREGCNEECEEECEEECNEECNEECEEEYKECNE